MLAILPIRAVLVPGDISSHTLVDFAAEDEMAALAFGTVVCLFWPRAARGWGKVTIPCDYLQTISPRERGFAYARASDVSYLGVVRRPCPDRGGCERARAARHHTPIGWVPVSTLASRYR